MGIKKSVIYLVFSTCRVCFHGTQQYPNVSKVFVMRHCYSQTNQYLTSSKMLCKTFWWTEIHRPTTGTSDSQATTCKCEIITDKQNM